MTKYVMLLAAEKSSHGSSVTHFKPTNEGVVMIQSLQIFALLMIVVSTVLFFVGMFRPFRGSKAFNFLSGESAFVTAVAYGALAMSELSWFSLFMVIVWFLLGSMKFAQSAWFTS